MRVFVTGATGYIGSAIVTKLISRGHSVLGLARSEASAHKLKSTGVEVFDGDLKNLESLKEGANLCDGVIHTAFNHDFSTYVQNCEDDRNVIEALGQTLQNSDRPLIVASGTAILEQGVLTDEKSTGLSAIPRVASEEAAQKMTQLGANVTIVRIPPTVHGEGDKGFISMYAQISKEQKKCVYIGEGQNVWPAVHRLDAAELFCLALERARKGSVFHGVAESGVAFKTIAETISQKLNLPIASIKPSEAGEQLSWFKDFARLDNPVSSAQTRVKLGWAPNEMGLIKDLRCHYFK